jgi:hypothetical protein
MKPLMLTIALVLWCAGFVSAGAAKAPTADEIKKKLAEIMTPKDGAGEREAALRRLKAYRFLAGLPYDITLDDEYNAACEAGAKLCAKLGKLDHTPDNPGLPEDDYKLAFKGTSKSNLGQGHRSLEHAVDDWMDDSDDSNIVHVGHRRWCLNPAMQKTGFGRSAAFSAMYSHDASRKKVPDYDFVSWPPAGLAPVEFFKKRSAWSVTLNPSKYNPAGEEVMAKVYVAGEKGTKVGDPLKLDFHGTNTQRFAVPNCVIFRPEKVEVAPGRRYVVEIEGLTRGAKKTPAMVRFTVEFISVK